MKKILISLMMLSMIVLTGILTSGCQTTRENRIKKYRSIAKEAKDLGIDLGKIYLNTKYGVNLGSDDIINQIIQNKIKEKEIERQRKKYEEDERKRSGQDVPSNNQLDNDNIIYNGDNSINFKIINEYQEEIAEKLLRNYSLNRDNMFLITQNFRITNYNSSGAWVDLTSDQTVIEEGDHNFKRAMVFIAFKKVDDTTLEVILGADQGDGNWNQNIGKAYSEADYLICYWVRRGQVKGRSQLWMV